MDDDSYDETLSSSPSIHGDEDIDFEFVYALRSFSATEQGQASATKGEAMVLLNDSNSYWWLVRIVKDSTVGFLPAEHIETPTERLARLNKHRNGDLCSTTYPVAGNGASSSLARNASLTAGGKSPVSPLARFFGRKSSTSSTTTMSTINSASNSTLNTSPGAMDSPESLSGKRYEKRKSVAFHPEISSFSASEYEYSDGDDDNNYTDDDYEELEEEEEQQQEIHQQEDDLHNKHENTYIDHEEPSRRLPHNDEESDPGFDDYNSSEDDSNSLSELFTNPGHIPIKIDHPTPASTSAPAPVLGPTPALALEPVAPLKARNSLLVAHSHQRPPASHDPRQMAHSVSESILEEEQDQHPNLDALSSSPRDCMANNMTDSSQSGSRDMNSLTSTLAPPTVGTNVDSTSVDSSANLVMKNSNESSTPSTTVGQVKGFKSFMKKVGLGGHGIQGEDLGADILKSGRPAESDSEDDQITPLNVKPQFKRRSFLNAKSSVEQLKDPYTMHTHPQHPSSSSSSSFTSSTTPSLGLSQPPSQPLPQYHKQHQNSSMSTTNTTFSRGHRDSTSTLDSELGLRPITSVSSSLKDRSSRTSVNLSLDLNQSRYPTGVRTSIHGRIEMPATRRRSLYGSQGQSNASQLPSPAPVQPLFATTQRNNRTLSAQKSAPQLGPVRVSRVDFSAINRDVEEIFSQARKQRDTLLMMTDEDDDPQQHEQADPGQFTRESTESPMTSDSHDGDLYKFNHSNNHSTSSTTSTSTSTSEQTHAISSSQHAFMYPSLPDLVVHDDESPTSEGLRTPMPSTPSITLPLTKLKPQVVVSAVEPEDSSEPGFDITNLHPDIAPIFRESSQHMDQLCHRLDAILSGIRAPKAN